MVKYYALQEQTSTLKRVWNPTKIFNILNWLEEQNDKTKTKNKTRTKQNNKIPTSFEILFRNHVPMPGACPVIRSTEHKLQGRCRSMKCLPCNSCSGEQELQGKHFMFPKSWIGVVKLIQKLFSSEAGGEEAEIAEILDRSAYAKAGIRTFLNGLFLISLGLHTFQGLSDCINRGWATVRSPPPQMPPNNLHTQPLPHNLCSPQHELQDWSVVFPKKTGKNSKQRAFGDTVIINFVAWTWLHAVQSCSSHNFRIKNLKGGEGIFWKTRFSKEPGGFSWPAGKRHSSTLSSLRQKWQPPTLDFGVAPYVLRRVWATPPPRQVGF